MNPAELAVLEELLASLLATSKTHTALLEKLAGGFKSGGGGAAEGMAGFTKNISIANIAVSAISTAFNILSSIVGKVFEVIGEVIGSFVNLTKSLFNLAKATADGTTKLSDFYAAFKDIPLLGTFFGLISDIISVQEKYLDTYQKLSNSGATLTGSLSDVTRAMFDTKLSLSELQSVVSKNSQAFATIGEGNVAVGYERFLRTNSLLLKESGQELSGLGYTAEQLSNALGTIMQTQMRVSGGQEVSNQQLAKFTKEYLYQLDEVTRLTGIQREELDKKVREAQEDQLWQLFVSNLTPTQAERARIAVAMAVPYGDDYVKEIKARLRGMNAPVTEFGARMAVSTNGLILSGQGLNEALMATGTDTKNMGKVMGQYNANISMEMVKFGRVIGPAALSAGVGAEFINGMFLKVGLLMEKYGGDYGKAVAEIEKDQKNAAKGTAGAFAVQELAVKNFGVRFMGMIANILGPLMPGLEEFAKRLEHLIEEVINSPLVKRAFHWLGSAFDEINRAFSVGSKEGFQKMWDKLKEGVGNIWKVVGPPFLKAWNEDLLPVIKSSLISLFEFLAKEIALAVVKLPYTLAKAMLKSAAAHSVERGKNPKSEVEAAAASQANPTIDWVRDWNEMRTGPGRPFLVGPDRTITDAALWEIFQEKNPKYKTSIDKWRKSLTTAAPGAAPATATPATATPTTTSQVTSKSPPTRAPTPTSSTTSPPAKSETNKVEVYQPDIKFKSLFEEDVGKALNISNYFLALIAENTAKTHFKLSELDPNLLNR
jgi:hypothetical protein